MAGRQLCGGAYAILTLGAVVISCQLVVPNLHSSMLSSPYAKAKLALGLLVLFSALSLILLSPVTRQHVCALSTNSVPVQQHDQRKLHFLVPVNSGVGQGHPTFCKTIFSAIVHGYEPTVINWHLTEGDMHRLKIAGMRYSYCWIRTPSDEIYLQGVHDYLSNITDANAETEMVFMVDAFDVWFQLSPRVLLERFDELNTTGVVVGAERVCFPNENESVSLG
jgi:hypothetical protein